MRTLIYMTLTVVAAFIATLPSARASEYLLISAGGQIVVQQLDDATGDALPHHEVALPGAGPIGFSPDKRFVYVSNSKGTDGKKGSPHIATLSFGPDKRLKIVANHPVNNGPGYLMTDKGGNYLSGSHYGSGSFSIWKLEQGIFTGTTVEENKVETKAHSTRYSPDGHWLFVPATEPNKVFQFQVDAKTGKATPNSKPFAAGPQGDNEARQPRHLIFHPTLPVVYTTLERLNPGVGVWSWDSTSGQLAIKQNLISIRPGFTQTITTADLHLTLNGKFLYVSNRDTTDQKAKTGADDIVGYSVNSSDGTLTLIGNFPCERIPRSFTTNAAGTFLYVGGQGDGKLGIYQIDQTSGALTRVKQIGLPGNPGWVTTVSW